MMGQDGTDILKANKPAALWEPVRTARRLWSYYVSCTAVFLLGVQIITGCLLALHYQPNVRNAHESVAAIATRIPTGWIVRSVHHTSANVLVILVILHALHTLLSKTFRAKRSLTYYTGILLFMAIMMMCFTGYILPWDTVSLTATAVGTGLPGEIPWIGPSITEFLRAGASIGATTLSRFFVFHVSMIPMALGLGLSFHILLIRRHGMRLPLDAKRKRLRFYPDFMLRQSVVCLWIFALVVTWAILFPTQLRPEGDPMAAAIVGIKPEWYFLAAYEAVKLGGNLTLLSGIGISAELLTLILMAAICVVIFLMPLLDKRGRGLVWKGFILVGAVAFIVLTIISMFAPQAEGQTVTEVSEAMSALSAKTNIYLVPFWLTVLTLTWFLSKAIRLCDRITASGLSRQAPKK